MKKKIVVSLLFIGLLACNKIRQKSVFKAISPDTSGLRFKNSLLEKKTFGILYYLYYFNGGGVGVGDINNDGLQDIYFAANNPGGNKLYLNKGNFKFEDITAQAGVAGTADWSTGVSMVDINGDGFLDIYVSVIANIYGLKGHNQLFINQKNNSFKESSADYGLDFEGHSTQTAFFDYDHDGDLDCYILNQSLQPNQNIRPAHNRNEIDPKAGDKLFRNDNLKFKDISQQAGIYQGNLGYGLGLAVSDFNNDGWEDVYVGNDFHENDYYYINQKNGAFSEKGIENFGHYSRFSMGNDAADINNDGKLDLITLDMMPDNEKILKTYGSDEQFDTYQFKIISNGYQYQFSKNCLQINNGFGFSETALLANVAATDWSWCPLFADFDHDSYKDLFISSGIVKRPVDLDYIKYVSDLTMQRNFDGTDKYDEDAIAQMPDGSSHPYLFKGDGHGAFEDVSDQWGVNNIKGYFNGAAYADLDNDGDLDIVTNNIHQEATLLENQTNSSGLSVNLTGEGLNTQGIGAKVFVFAKGNMQYQQLMPVRGFMSSSSTVLNFGLGVANTPVDSVVVVWPNQKYQTIKKPKNILNVSQNKAQEKFDLQMVLKKEQQPLFTTSILPFSHQENFFNDFSAQPLLPHKLSTRGPKIAVGDVNADGKNDFYICGASNQNGALFLQKETGFSSMPFPKNMPETEEVDAVIFDANQDGKKDILIISGGNQFPDNDQRLADALYLNQNSTWVKSTTFPQIKVNKSCVTAGDIDQDGDTDLFIGVMAGSHSYGILPDSYLLLNDGKGNFSQSQMISTKKMGIITDAAILDLNKDQAPDLVVVGEFMPVRVYLNQKNKTFQTIEIEKSEGLWQSVDANDINADGFPDLLLGNYGLNNKFTHKKDGRLSLYTKDFDKNQTIDQLLSYYIKGKEYPFLPKDEIEKPMPVLRKHYTKYADYAGLEMKDAFYGFVDQVEPLKVNMLNSAIGLNQGKGVFKLKALPYENQKAPIFGMINFGEGFLTVGNFFDVPPYEGRYDAQTFSAFRVKNNQPSHWYLPINTLSHQQGRDIKIIDKKYIIVAVNNGPLTLLQRK